MAFAKDLRASVLQAAMQGKLTEQLETDTPVSKLLTDIKAEKDRLIAEKKIKKEKPLSAISDDDIPFDIPSNWQFVRLGDMSVLKNGYSFKNTEYKTTGIQIVRISDLSGNEISTKNAVYYAESEELNKYKIADNSILICMTGSIGKMALVKTAPKAYLNQRVGMLIPSKVVSLDYIYHYLNCEHVIFDWNTAKTSTNGNIKSEDITNIVIPLPPIEEQKRIVQKIEEIMIRINELEAIEEELKKLKEVFPADMKAAVLQAAMQGKLTEQLETDSSVDDLLEDIKKERERLVAEGKIKKSRTKQNDNFVQFNDGEEPFEIPDNWRWVNFGGVVSLLSGQDLTPDKYNNSQNGIIYLTGASNIENGDIIINRWTTEPKSIAYRGDILLTCKGTIGKIATLQEDKAHIARQIMSISPILVNKQFVVMFLEHYVSKLKNKAKSIIPGIERKDIINAPFPLPPLEEQNRIVAKLEQILPLISDLS